MEGRRYVLKHLGDDWIQRSTGDTVGRTWLLWAAGLLDDLPGEIDHTVVAAARVERGQPVVLMRDVSDLLVTARRPADLEQHRRFVDHLAALHAHFWEFHDDKNLTPLSNYYLVLSPLTVETEARLGNHNGLLDGPVALGWERLSVVAPAVAAVAAELHRDPSPLLEAVDATPHTLIHGDFRLANLGSHPDGRTIAIDWTMTGRGPGCADLAWYLASHPQAVPGRPGDAIQLYRAALEARGVDTGGWWDHQLALCLLGAFLQFGWDLVTAGDEHLRWWADRALAAHHLLDRTSR